METKGLLALNPELKDEELVLTIKKIQYELR